MLEATATMGWMGDRFIVIPDYVAEDDSVDHFGMVAYFALRYYMNQKSGMVCWPSLKTLATVGRCSKDSIRRGIKVLEQCGYVQVVHRETDEGDPASNLYKLLNHPIATGNEGSSPQQQGYSPTTSLTISNEQEPTNKNIPSPPAPVRRGRKAKHDPETIALANDLAAKMQELAGPWSAYASQMKAMYDLIDYAHRAAPEAWQDFLRTFFATAWKVRKSDKWMKDKPYTPRFLYSCAETIAEKMKAKVVSDPFAEYEK